jgi:signal transduction histidine kinase
VPAVKLSNEQRRNIFLVSKEALNNALKHSAASRISLSMEYKDKTIHFYIKDNGKGFDEKKRKVASNGLKNMQRRMTDIGGSFHIQTNDTGCFICFSLQVSGMDKNRRTTFFTFLKKH